MAANLHLQKPSLSHGRSTPPKGTASCSWVLQSQHTTGQKYPSYKLLRLCVPLAASTFSSSTVILRENGVWHGKEQRYSTNKLPVCVCTQEHVWQSWCLSHWQIQYMFKQETVCVKLKCSTCKAISRNLIFLTESRVWPYKECTLLFILNQLYLKSEGTVTFHLCKSFLLNRAGFVSVKWFIP